MNAYKLADELWEKYLDNNECQHGYALSNGCPNDDCKEQALYDSATMLRQQADRIAELENKKPTRVKFASDSCESGWIYLDTHPVKQLSDEEIANIWAEHTKVAGTYDVKDIVFPFARAIIKEITGNDY